MQTASPATHRPAFSTLSDAPLIDLERDELSPVVDLLTERLKKRMSGPTYWRWMNRGVNGTKLQAVKIGRTWMSTRRAVAAFFSGGIPTPAPTPATEAGERSESTRQRLAAAGLLPKCS